MRMFMLTHRPPDGWQTIGATLTIPGPVLSPDERRRLWGNFKRRLIRRGWCCVWRLELQRRGQAHWHAIIGLPAGTHRSQIQVEWLASLDSLGPQVWPDGYSVKVNQGTQNADVHMYFEIPRLSLLPGALHYAVHLQSEGGRGSWLRYLQDHATKAKQEQIATEQGRHWGVIGKKLFRQVEPAGVSVLTEKEYRRFLRLWRRCCTPIVKAPCVFGCKRGYPPRRGTIGHSVWFTSSADVVRLVEYSKQERGWDNGTR
jgi:hypothetical protein